MAELRLLGPIDRIQIQREGLRNRTEGTYHPELLLPVERGIIGPPGIVGVDGSSWVVDVHHESHPRRRGGSERAVSIGFTSHYRKMNERYGPVPLGVAGENLIVRTDAVIGPLDLAGGVIVRTAGGSEIALGPGKPAAGCVEFTSFLVGHDRAVARAEIEADLAFVSDGTRGFVFSTAGLERAARVSVGDLVYVRRPDLNLAG